MYFMYISQRHIFVGAMHLVALPMADCTTSLGKLKEKAQGHNSQELSYPVVRVGYGWEGMSQTSASPPTERL